MSKGEIVQVIGPVVDVEFPLDKDLPDINNALHVTNNNGDTLVLEVTLELGDGVLRTISMESTDGLRRGMEVEDTGAPISVPVGKDTLGRVFNVLGDPIDGGPALGKDVKREGIHKEAPKYDELSTSEEIALLDKGPRSDKKITGEVCVHHLWFNDQAYREKGHFVKWNPAIKMENDRQALLKAVNEGIIDVIATDHAPHTLAEKSGPYTRAASGGPMIQHSLTVMLELAAQGAISLEKVVDSMCHAPAKLFNMKIYSFFICKPSY